jgi:hypothetical protein
MPNVFFKGKENLNITICAISSALFLLNAFSKCRILSISRDLLPEIGTAA